MAAKSKEFDGRVDAGQSCTGEKHIMANHGKPEDYDLLILGSGAGGKLLAWTFGGRGRRVAVVERQYVGGSCPNIACLPSKNIIHTAQFAHDIRRSEELELVSIGSVST